MKFYTNKTLITLAIGSVLSIGSIAGVVASEIENPSFEDNFDSWMDSEPSAISAYQYTGSKAAKITGSEGRFEQTISVEPGMSYTLSAYIKGIGTIGVYDGMMISTRRGGGDSYQQASVHFDAMTSSVTIFGEYAAGEGRFDDFSLKNNGPSVVDIMGYPSLCSDNMESSLAIVNVNDNGENDGHGPENTIDGDTSNDSRWSAKGAQKAITYDLGLESAVMSVGIQWYKGDSRQSYFDIDVSTDNINWQKVRTNVVSSGNSDSENLYAVQDIYARYVRITGLGNSDNTWNSIVETKVYGCEKKGVTIIRAAFPYQLMANYSQWKMTYPDHSEEKQLFNVSNEYFHVNDEGTGIVFNAPITDSGILYAYDVKSELTERTADGTASIFWTTDGHHSLYTKQAITHLPIVKSHLVAAQLEGNKEDGIDDAMVLRLEGEHLFLSFNGGKLREDITIKTDYVLGTVYELMFEVVDGKHYAYYSEDGQLSNALATGDASQYKITDADNEYLLDLNYDQAYFKTGAYLPTNADIEGDYAGHPDNYGEVVVYSVSAEHN